MKIKLELLTQNEIEKIHDCSLAVLEQVGVIFKKAAAVDIFKCHGAKVDGDIIYLTRDMVERALKTVPGSFPLYGRNPDKTVTIGGTDAVFAPPAGAVYVHDAEKGRRKGTCKDYVNLVRLVHTSLLIQVNGGNFVTAGDINHQALHAFMSAAMVKNTDKPLTGFTLGMRNAKECLEITRLAFGEDKENILLGVANVVTPLLYDTPMIEGIMEYVLNRQPVVIASCGMAGSTAPVTLGGLIACVNAELLAGIVFTQLLKEGTPVVYGNTSAISDMRTMNLAIGAVETAMINLTASQLAKFYGIPFRTGGCLSDSKEVDVQAGYESMLNMATTVFDGADFILQSVGIMDSFMTISYDKFVIDEEIGLMLKRFIKGFGVSEEDLAFQLIKAKGPGAHFLDAEHTLLKFRSEYFNPAISNRQPYEIWKENPIGAVGKAGQIWRSRLEQFQLPRLAPECEKAVNRYFIGKYGELPEILT